ncbi:serine hydrolase domain-containing protein [Streptomyces sp. NPDC047315]|uniref:serine hydrolase domain-containing protein n=1 Tax=Streptomyces sp. NPDC047315 TaxID=3155142 RepID=UPI0033C136BB
MPSVPLLAFAALLASTAPAAAAPPPPPASAHAVDPRPALQRGLDELTGRHGLAGAAAEVTGRGGERWSAASGRADLGTGRAMNATDRFRIGSITKTFTAATALQLVDEGLLSLDAPVDRYLPGLVRGNGYDGRTITVRQLLQHTSGLPDHSTALADADVTWLRRHHFTPRELVGLALREPRPASQWHYSTTNYVLVGMVIEQVTRRPVEAEVTRRVIEPLGLRDTYWPGSSPTIRGPHSRSYFTTHDNGDNADDWDDGEPVRVDGTTWNTSAGGAGGALISTASDVNAFFAALLDGRLLSPERLADMRTTVPGDPARLGPEGRYGLGLITGPLSCGGRFTGHTGGTRAGHHTIGAVAADGRQVTVVVNETPRTDASTDALLAVMDTALCR